MLIGLSDHQSFHRIVMTKRERDPHEVAELIEQRLGVKTDVLIHGDHGRYAAISWTGPRDVDLDFLRPDILPPKEAS